MKKNKKLEYNDYSRCDIYLRIKFYYPKLKKEDEIKYLIRKSQLEHTNLIVAAYDEIMSIYSWDLLENQFDSKYEIYEKHIYKTFIENNSFGLKLLYDEFKIIIFI